MSFDMRADDVSLHARCQVGEMVARSHAKCNSSVRLKERVSAIEPSAWTATREQVTLVMRAFMAQLDERMHMLSVKTFCAFALGLGKMDSLFAKHSKPMRDDQQLHCK